MGVGKEFDAEELDIGKEFGKEFVLSWRKHFSKSIKRLSLEMYPTVKGKKQSVKKKRRTFLCGYLRIG